MPEGIGFIFTVCLKNSLWGECKMNVKVDQDECVGCGACVEIAGDVFRINSDDKSEVYGKVTDGNKPEVQEAIDTCPVSAISWE